ncbi:MAG: phenylalanine--tRNA ligase subunit beta [Clostridia bacterium]|nr:phenylalanine--tRNA ligase subunit beta [Clostridia bacterium]
MKTPLSWINDYVQVTDIDAREFCEAMTMSGSKVESFESAGDAIKNVVIAKILKIEKHPNADKLVVCSMDVGRGEPVQIITGATNVSEGDIVPAALDGAKLPGGMSIKKSKMRGVESYGMLCSVGELGLSAEDFPGAIENGILILNDSYTVGEDAKTALGLNEVIVEFEITPNRPDCLCMTGIGREASATFKRPFSLPSLSYTPDENDKIENYVTAEVRNHKLCPRYMLKVVKDVKIAPSPAYIQKRLTMAGVRPINNIVDITNYVMLEMGIPMHAFDHKLIGGSHIIVRNAEPGEKLVTLDDIERTLTPDMLVICDAEKPVAVAGIMGGEHSGINDDTTTIVFEAANFNGHSIRTTSKTLGLRSESSSRFEKGLDPHMCELAIERACALIDEFGAGRVVSGTIDERGFEEKNVTVKLDADKINRFLGADISRDEMVKSLELLNFKVSGDDVIVPTFRGDVEHWADLAEEVARIYGYDKIPSSLYAGSGSQAILTPLQKFERKAAEILLSNGCFEIFTYSFISPKVFDMLNIPADDKLRDTVKISNPLGEDTSVMRTTTLHSMLDALARNYNYKNTDASLFEISNVYIKNEDETKLPDEQKKITIGTLSGDFFDLKGIVESLLAGLRVGGAQIRPMTDNPMFHPGRAAVYSVGKRDFAVLGEIHPAIAKNYGIDAPVYCAVVDFASAYRYSKKSVSYNPLPRFPAITRDLAFVVNRDMLSGDIEAVIKKYAGKLLEKVSLFDVYEGKQIGEGKKSMAYSVVLRDREKTLTDKNADEVVAKILKGLAGDLGVELRS